MNINLLSRTQKIMEFAEGLKQATELGLSKEEFMLIWNKEMDLQILNHNVDNYKLSEKENKLTESQVLELQNLKIASQELKLELVSMRNEIFIQNRDLLATIKQIVNQQENQELVALMKSVHDILMETTALRTYMEHMTKKVDDLSLEFKSEIYELKQKLSSLSVQQSCTGTSEVSSAGCSQSDSSSNWAEEKLQKVHGDNEQEIAAPNSDALKLNGNDFPDHALDTKQHPCKTTKSFTKFYQNKTFFNYPKVKAAEPKVETTNFCDTIAVPLSTSLGISLENTASESAELNQITETVASSLTSSGKECSNTVNAPNGNNKVPKKSFQNGDAEDKSSVPSTSSVLADYGVSFTIPETHPFYNGKEDFFTNFYPLKKIPCKVRMRLRLDKDGKILVSAMISFFKNCEAKLPLSLCGNGYISAKLSGGRGHSQMWDIRYTLRHKPEKGEELCVDAQVCLLTNRNTYSNITYSKLVDMGYDQKKHLKFVWDFAAYPIPQKLS